MSEDQNKAPNPDPFEEEIGELLAEAEALTSELSGEIGVEENETNQAADILASELEAEATTDLLMQEAEHALAEAATELGGEKPDRPTKGFSLPPSNSVSLPEKSAPTSAPTGATVSLPSQSSGAKTEALVAAKTTQPAVESKPEKRSPRAEACKRKLAELSERLEPVTRVLCTVLDTLDRPFGRIQFPLRALMGWLALVFFVAAISLWIFAVN